MTRRDWATSRRRFLPKRWVKNSVDINAELDDATPLEKAMHGFKNNGATYSLSLDMKFNEPSRKTPPKKSKNPRQIAALRDAINNSRLAIIEYYSIKKKST